MRILLLLVLPLEGETERLQGVEKVDSKAKEEKEEEAGDDHGRLLRDGEVVSIGAPYEQPTDPPNQVPDDSCSQETDQQCPLLVDAHDASEGEASQDEVDGNIPATKPENLSCRLIMSKALKPVKVVPPVVGWPVKLEEEEGQGVELVGHVGQGGLDVVELVHPGSDYGNVPEHGDDGQDVGATHQGDEK